MYIRAYGPTISGRDKRITKPRTGLRIHSARPFVRRTKLGEKVGTDVHMGVCTDVPMKSATYVFVTNRKNKSV